MRVAVIGAGMLGLATAVGLGRRGAGVAVDVYEGAEQPGGLATWQDYGEFVWDRFYHCIVPSDRALVGFVRELGLGDRLRWTVTRTGFYGEGACHSVSDTAEFLRFPLLPLADKLRLGAALAYCARIRDWRRLEAVWAEDWLRRLCGRRAWETMWRPLLRAKYGEAYRRVSAVAIWAAITRLYSARQPGVGREMLGYVEGGYRTILGAAMARVEAAGGKIRLGAAVARIERAGRRFLVVTGDGTEEFDQVVVTVPATLAARLLPDLAVDRARLARIEYLGVVCLALVLDRALSPFYILNIADDQVPFTGVIGMSNLVAPDQTAGRHLVYLPKYVPAADPFYAAGDDAVRAAFFAGLRRMFPAFDERWVVRSVVSRAPRVQPLQVLGYSRLVDDTPSPAPGLHVVNTARLANATLNNDEVVRLAQGLVRDVLAAAPGGGR
jgi:protoporphyrinogen oxidase